MTIGENSSLDSVDAIKNKRYKQWNRKCAVIIISIPNNKDYQRAPHNVLDHFRFRLILDYKSREFNLKRRALTEEIFISN